MPEEFFKWLGIKAPPEKGDYFLPLSRYMKDQLKIERIDHDHPVFEESQRCSQRPKPCAGRIARHAKKSWHESRKNRTGEEEPRVEA